MTWEAISASSPLSLLKQGTATPRTTQNLTILQELLIIVTQRCSNLLPCEAWLHPRHISAVCGGVVLILTKLRSPQKCGKDEGIHEVIVNEGMIINTNSLREYLNINGHKHSGKWMVWVVSQLPHKTSLQGGGRCISIAESQIKVSAFRKKHDHLPRCCSERRYTGRLASLSINIYV